MSDSNKYRPFRARIHTYQLYRLHYFLLLPVYEVVGNSPSRSSLGTFQFAKIRIEDWDLGAPYKRQVAKLAVEKA